jgi:hypothetical protein
MALSISALTGRGSLVPDGAGGWKLQVSTKFKWDIEKFKKREGAARMKALSKVGLRVKHSCQKQISARRPNSRPRQWKIANRQGFDLIALVNRVPHPNRLTSWRTRRNPSGMLRNDIQDDYDSKSRSVVVGPSRLPWLNQMHEFGKGSSRVYFSPIARRTRGKRVLGVLKNTPPTVGVGRDKVAQAGIYSFTFRVKARPYMAKGLAAVRKKIPEEFRNQLRGP